MIGEVIEGYRISRLLGRGAMGEVYEAEDDHTGMKAAIKVLCSEVSRDGDAVQRLWGEAHAANRINHPGIVDVIEFGQHSNGRAFVVMEYLEGESLRACLLREERLTAGMAVEIAGQVAATVAAAHDRGLVHRGLKPENIFITRDAIRPDHPRIKVLDFGAAPVTGLGTPAYMSPEQCGTAAPIDHRTDIYALGCILFEMLLGQTPFTTNSDGEMRVAQMCHPIPPLERNGVDRELAPIVRRALAKNAAARYETIRAMSMDLLRARSSYLRTNRAGIRGPASAGGGRRANGHAAITQPYRKMFIGDFGEESTAPAV